MPVSVLVRNRLVTSDRVPRAVMAVDPPPVGPPVAAATTNNLGVASLDLSRVRDGQHTLSVLAEHASTDPVGPALAAGATTPRRIFRPLDLTITVNRGRITGVRSNNQTNGMGALGGNPQVIIDLQPVWMQSPNHGNRGSSTVSLIIVHHTGGSRITNALNWFSTTTSRVSAHYVIDVDGQIVKMVQDVRAANHAGTSYWRGSTSINSESIGIEIVNASGAYPEAQYVSLLGLLERLRGAHRGVPADGIIGHSDIATNARGQLGRKSSDPGLQFEWARLEAVGLGLMQNFGPWPTDVYGGFFQLVSGGSLRENDNDTAQRFGGSRRAGVTGTPIADLQSDLQAIGYSVGRVDGDFGGKTRWAVYVLQEHFFAGGRGHKAPDGRVDLATAHLIKSIR